MTTTVPDKYGEQLSQLEPWNDMFDIIVTRHSLNSSAQRRMGRGGTFPTAVIGDRIVKLFPEFLFVPLCYEAELVAYELLWQATDLPVPQLLATGSSNETGNGWHWPYVVLTVIDGVDLTSCKSELSQESWINLAHWLGGVVKELHAMEHNKSWLAFKSFMQEQRSVTASRHPPMGNHAITSH